MASNLTRLLDRKTPYLSLIVIIICVLFFALIIGFTYFLWFIAIPYLAKWGFGEPFNSETFWWGAWSVIKYLISGLAIVFSAVLPGTPFTLLQEPISVIVLRYFSETDIRLRQSITENKKKREEYEEIVRKEEGHGLISLVNFSKYELEQYYQIGLEQGKKSYKTSMLAMWIGFIILLCGIIMFLIPASGFFSLKEVDKTNIQTLTLASGIVSEIIAGLFLWIYKNSRNQLTYFYNRQIFIHNSLLAYKIATTMTKSDKQDTAKQVIIDKILAFGTVSSGMTQEGEPISNLQPKRVSKGAQKNTLPKTDSMGKQSLNL